MNRRWIGGSVAAFALSAAALTAPAAAETSEPAAAEGDTGYEVWASDQSNSVAGQSSPGVRGSYLWIWDSEDIAAQLDGDGDATPLGCAGDGTAGPCDLLDVFPQDLQEYGPDGQPTGALLGDLDGFGRLHGMTADPQQRYMTANIFAPGGGYVGIIDRRSKGAVALFRATKTTTSGGTRSVHMSFWSKDGSQILVANLNGKVLERIDVTRAADGTITAAEFDRSASLGVGRDQAVDEGATVFRGLNQQGDALLGRIGGDYADADLGDLTPTGACKENGCADGEDGARGGRPNNVIICPITSDAGLAYVTFGGGGLLVADTSTTPMTIVGEYGNQVINGAGCGGVQTGARVWLNAGVSAGGAGATWSTFTVYTLPDRAYRQGRPQNTPAPEVIFRDGGNTATGGALTGEGPNTSGQLAGETTRRDSHGAAVTGGGAYVQMGDRLQNVVESFSVGTGERITYDLATGACAARAADGVPAAYADDPSPDLMRTTPDGRYLMIGLRGPAPVSVTHSAQGACPGVGIVELSADGSTGELVDVLRSTNTVDTAPASAPGGYAYEGDERSDVHDATVIAKN